MTGFSSKKNSEYVFFIEKELEIENKRRETAIQKGEVIYGNKSYNMSIYMNYYLSNLTRELIRVMENKELKYTEDELLQYCMENGKEMEDFGDRQSLNNLYGFEMKNFLFDQYILKRVEESCVEFNKNYMKSYWRNIYIEKLWVNVHKLDLENLPI